MASENPPDDGTTFTSYEIGENAARELALAAEQTAEDARKLPTQNPARIEMMHAAAAALAAATPFLDRKDKRRFADAPRTVHTEVVIDGEKLAASRPPVAAA